MSSGTASLQAARRPTGRGFHAVLVAVLACALLLIMAFNIAAGFGYYRLSISERPFHPLHRELRPSGQTGIRMGLLSTALFAAIYLYPLRKRWKWLGRIGRTKRWLDFHIVMGLCVSVIVALHSAFKFGGLAGMAYWMMVAVVLSGLAGRYLYAQIPRSRDAAELTLTELEQMRAALAGELIHQSLPPGDLNRILQPVDRSEVLRMTLWRALAKMLALDVKRPFQMAALRRQGLTAWERIVTLWGFTASRHRDLERTVEIVRRQSWLTAKICLLERAGEVFRLWHVVHRPFSYAFLVLVTAHIGTVLLMGYF